MPFFEQIHRDKNSRGRTGVIHTDHGDINTPAFMPVGTQASVKALDSQDLKNINAEIILGNTYHLHLRPGADLIATMGGLHKFMSWERPILTDSGGFQVFSLGKKKRVKPMDSHVQPNEIKTNEIRNNESEPKETPARLVSIDEDGVTFRSHLDGSTHRFTPESAISTQFQLGADIIMAFDECTPDDSDKTYTTAAMNRTHRWASRSLEQAQRLATTVSTHRRFIFGIVQGSLHRELREMSARFIASLDFDGIALGGESIGYNMAATADILDWVDPFLPPEKPHYAMGVGLSPVDLLIAVEHGIDMFDCVAPTRLARHGLALGYPTRLNLKSAIYKKDGGPIDGDCRCSTCEHYSRSYLHHLFAAEELSVLRLTSIHNLHFLINLMKKVREAINEDRFMELAASYRK